MKLGKDYEVRKDDLFPRGYFRLYWEKIWIHTFPAKSFREAKRLAPHYMQAYLNGTKHHQITK